ncbi:MAG TPA: exonuclease [Candidatus Pacearchaeota archaeon]|nr:exonuclease [Candidatus Pacearchaeota archaeon]
MTEIYISTDVETDGPIPGEYSMLSLGSVAFDQKGKILGNFYKKLKKLKNAKQHPKTMEFWKENLEDYKEATKNAQSPTKVMKEYVGWLEELKRKTKSQLIFLSWPLCLDYPFVFWYMVKFVKKFQKIPPFEIPFSFGQGIDTKTFAMAHLKRPYQECSDSKLPKKWFKGTTSLDKKWKSHNALDDALREGKIFIKMLKENQESKK